MSNLTVINQNGTFWIESRDVAEMTGKDHAHLLRDIDSYVITLTRLENPELDYGLNTRVSNFFIPSEYESGNPARKYRCYLLTRKGCDMVANKMTGEKGVLFTAAYVTKFEEMERQTKPQCIEDLIIMQATSMKELRAEVRELKGTTQAIKDTIITQPDNWREDLNKMFNKIALAIDQHKFRELRMESYKLLEQRARVNLTSRLMNYQTRLLGQGANKTTIAKANKLDVIEQDAKLREIYAQIIKEYYIKHVA